MLLAKRLVALRARLALAGDLPVGLGVLDLPALANEGAGESGHLPGADPAAASPAASGGSVAPRCRGVPWATPLPTHPGRRSAAEGEGCGADWAAFQRTNSSAGPKRQTRRLRRKRCLPQKEKAAQWRDAGCRRAKGSRNVFLVFVVSSGGTLRRRRVPAEASHVGIQTLVDGSRSRCPS